MSKRKIEIRDATTLDLKCDARIKQRGRANESAIWQEEGCPTPKHADTPIIVRASVERVASLSTRRDASWYMLRVKTIY